MPYSCFISYRHTKQYKGQSYVERIVEDLKAELEMRVAQEVFRDTERLEAADLYDEALAYALCQSICMVVLYWPTYFSEKHTFCAREFKAMERLEKQRLQLLKPEERQKGLIIILAIRDFKEIPSEIRAQRLCKDLEELTIQSTVNLRDDPKFQAEIAEVSKYIADRCRAFQHLSGTFGGCENFRLPPTEEVLPWLRDMARPILSLPNL